MKQIIGVVLLCLVLASSAMCADASMSTTLTGPLCKSATTMSMEASASLSGDVWTYIYTVTIENSMLPVTGFTVGNLAKVNFFNATNDKNFTNPTFTGTDSVLWTGGYVTATQGPITFSYQSYLPPSEVVASVIGGARSASGVTIGAVPEPASLAALGMMMLGAAPAILRRKRSK